MILKKLLKERKKMVNLKMTPSEIETCRRLARKYTGGNFSEWVRTACTTYHPSKSEVTRSRSA